MLSAVIKDQSLTQPALCRCVPVLSEARVCSIHIHLYSRMGLRGNGMGWLFFESSLWSSSCIHIMQTSARISKPVQYSCLKQTLPPSVLCSGLVRLTGEAKHIYSESCPSLFWCLWTQTECSVGELAFTLTLYLISLLLSILIIQGPF